MNITVINGTEKHGVTYRLKEMFLTEFRDEANITEYYLPKDCPNFCVGCLNCILKGEKTCKDAEYIRKMDESLLKADLIVMTSPAYVFHVTGAMKALLDHFAYRWMPHRPAPEMFGKRAVIITQCLTVPDEKEQPIGVWGQRHLRYLKEYRRATYITLLTSGRLNAYLADIDKQAQERMERLTEQMKRAQGITEQLKAENALEWVQRMNNIRACAREIVEREIIYT